MNTYWIGENRPCLIYGLRGVIDVEIEITGPLKDLHTGGREKREEEGGERREQSVRDRRREEKGRRNGSGENRKETRSGEKGRCRQTKT